MDMRKKRLIILLVSLIFLLSFFSSVSAKMYYEEDECIIFIRQDKIVYFRIVNGEVVGGYIIKIGISNVVGIKKGVLHSYYDGTGKPQTEIQTMVVVRNNIPDTVVRVKLFGESKMINIPIYFISSTSSTENSEKNL